MGRIQQDKRMNGMRSAALWLLLLTGPGQALDSLIVGLGAEGYSWREVELTSHIAGVTDDSVFKWNVGRNTNLIPGMLEREGSIKIFDLEEHFDAFRGGVEFSRKALETAPGLENMFDGDADTAFDPAVDPDMPSRMEIYIDLGDVFNVNRLRLFPRQDDRHDIFFPQVFAIATHDGSAFYVPREYDFIEDWRPYDDLFGFSRLFPNREPMLERVFQSRPVRHIRLRVDRIHPWEIAEVEVYSDGSLPLGEFISVALLAETRFPIWGRVLYEGGNIADLPIVVQTRTGPDPWPFIYYARNILDGSEEEVPREIYDRLERVSRGSIKPSPKWSAWENLEDGVVRSPAAQPFVQFRLLLSQPRTVLRQLILEYVSQPLLEELEAEIDPLSARGGEEVLFTLSLQAHMTESRRVEFESRGFRQLQILTQAQVSQVERVLVDDVEVLHTETYQPGLGFTVHLGERILRDTAFLQIAFRARIFRDGTRFEIRALDRRNIAGRIDSVYQAARPGDVDPLTLSQSLVVRLEDQGMGRLLENIGSKSRVFTPNGDGVNDVGSIFYDLFKLTHEVPVQVDIYDLSGRKVKQLYAGGKDSGHCEHEWDGRDMRGMRVPPGAYLYQVRVDADARTETRRGLIGVVY